jgi:regulatory protein
LGTSKTDTGTTKENRAYSRALRLLTYRPRTRSELAEKLRSGGFEEVDIAGALNRLSRLGYIDDEEYARNWAAGVVRRRKYGPLRIEGELRRRGIQRETARNAAWEAVLEVGEGILAGDILEKRFLRTGSPGDRKGKARLVDYLVRRGISRGTAVSAVETWLKSRDGD